MKRLLGNLIVVSPASASIHKLRYTPAAIAMLVIAVVGSFFAVVMLGHSFHPLVTDREQTRLEMENQQLKVNNRNEQLKIENMNNRVTNLEEQSHRIQELISTE